MPRYSALIVEDDAGLRDSLGLVVGREGYDVRYASSLAEAKRLLAELAADVVLLDLGLPDGDGIELLRDEDLAVRSDFIVMTGNASVESAVQALRVGSLDYLTKPVDRDRLRTLLAGV
ncbi:MAG TPA: response regulator, partial [Verrucomicrobiae bacterium]|nr:response regulator [Verrucomicrobiae bacterium]